MVLGVVPLPDDVKQLQDSNFEFARIIFQTFHEGSQGFTFLLSMLMSVIDVTWWGRLVANQELNLLTKLSNLSTE